MTINYLIYSPLKYKDDGRDIVSVIDFVTIHMTFPAINAWVSYQLYYTILVTWTTVCSTDLFKGIDQSYCDNYHSSTAE